MSKFAFYTLVLQGIFTGLLLADDAKSQSTSIDDVFVDVQFENASIKEVFESLESKTTFNFSYNQGVININETVTAVGSNQSLGDFLRQLAKDTKLNFTRIDDQIYVSKRKTMQPAVTEKLSSISILQQRTITGTVTSLEDNMSLPGVSVILKGTSTGTVTDIDGKYAIDAPDGAVIVFSYVGYVSEETVIGNNTVINMALAPDLTQLEEIVVIGYGTVKKSDLTGSVSSVKSKELTAYPAINAVQALQGRAAGVNITANNGEPGADFKIRIRGGTSINASSDPIFVVDGFVGATLPPPEDIESMEVLKDASATAIYGSRGANGVIMVTTRRGKSGKPRIELNTSYSSQNEINRLDLLNAEQFTAYIQEARPTITPLDGDTDWQDEIFRTGSIQNYQLAISGGNEAVNYYVSGAYFDQKGVIIGSQYNRFSITSNIDIKASKKMRMGLNLFAQRTGADGTRTQEGSGGASNTGVVAGAFKFEPDQHIRDANGIYTVARLNDIHDNPYAIAKEYINESLSDRIQGNLYAEYDIFKDLKFRITLGATSVSARGGQFNPTLLNAGRNVGGDGSMSGNKNTNLQNENYFSYNKTIFKNHELSAMAGFSYQAQENSSWSGRGQGFVSDAFSYWNLGASSVWMQPTSNLSEWSLKSYYGRINYGINGKYLFNFNARYDGSSTFSENHKWAFFPSGSFAWNMGSESFMDGVKLISQWKWRVSYGLTGNQAINPFQTLASFSNVFTVINNNAVNAVRPTSIANNNLTWETTAQLNLGTDLSFAEDRINFSADVYRMVTSDLLFQVPLPQYSGYPSQLQNIGEVENKGFELTLGAKVLTGAFQWDTDVNMSMNRNQILSLPNGKDILYGSGPGHMVGLGDTQILREGEPVGTFYGWIYDGVYQEGDDFLPGGGFETSAGGEKFRDIDGIRDADGNLTGEPDARLDANDRTIIGDPNPDFIWGWNNDFRWKNFDVNIFFQGSQGNDILSYTLLELDLMSGINNATTRALDRWTPTNTTTDVPKAFNGRARRVSTRFITDGSFVRLKNLALGYNLPTTAAEKMKLSRLRIYISAQNIFTVTKYEGYDPEVNYNSGGGVNGNRNLGLDYGSYPNAKSYTVGLNIGF